MNSELESRISLLQKQGIHFWVDLGKLKYKSAGDPVSQDDLAWLQENFRGVACFCLERELARLRVCFQACVDFEYKPFKRDLSPECIAAGKKSLKIMHQQIQSMEQEIQCLKTSA